MGEISQTRRRNYYRIYEQIYEDPSIPLYGIAKNTGLSRNTVTKYLREMYIKSVLIGPYTAMKPAPNYKEYVYLMNFSDPLFVFRALKGFPRTLQYDVALGNWNTMVITDKDLDFSRLVGFQSMVAKGIRGLTYTPKVECTSWEEAFENMYDQIRGFTPVQSESRKHVLHSLDWGNEEWKLFHTFKSNIRQKVTPTLRKIKVRYETYSQWMKTLEDHCTIHVEFYPEELETYMGYSFLFSAGYNSLAQSLFSLLPASSIITGISDQLLVCTRVPSPDTTRRLFCTIYDMKAVGIIEEFSYATLLQCDGGLNL